MQPDKKLGASAANADAPEMSRNTHQKTSYHHHTASATPCTSVGALAEQLRSLPAALRYTPLGDRKNPIQGTGWAMRPLALDQLIDAFPHCRAIGLRLGVASGGIVAVDRDGASSDAVVQRLSGALLGEALPQTLANTSGREGRSCHYYQIPSVFWSAIASKNFPAETAGEALQLRWGADGQAVQQVLVGVHPETDGYRWVAGCGPDETAIATAPQWIIEAMLESGSADTPTLAPTLPLSVSPSNEYPSRWAEFERLPMPLADAVPLEVAIAPASRDALGGVGEGARNSTGAALARDLIGTAAYLNTIDQRYDGSPEGLFGQYCDRCSPPIDQSERGAIWKSAERDRPGPSLSLEKIDTCVRAWIWKNCVKPTPRRSPHAAPNNVVPIRPGGVAEPVAEPTLREELEAIAQRNLGGVELDLTLAELGQRWRMSAADLKKLLDGLEMAEADGLAEDVETALSLRTAGFQALQLLPTLGHALGQLSSAYGAPDATAVLIAIASATPLLNPGITLITPSRNVAEPYKTRGSIFSALVAASGSGKSDLVKQCGGAELEKLQALEDERFDAISKQFKCDFAAWIQRKTAAEKMGMPFNEAEPEKPAERALIFTGGTMEGLLDALSSQPNDDGILGLFDELKTLLSSLGEYKHGGGTDRSILLSLWSSAYVDRRFAGGRRLKIKSPLVSIMGGIQPSALTDLMGKNPASQTDGMFQRFLYVNLAGTAEFNEINISIKPAIASTLQQLEAIPSGDFRLSPDATERYKNYQRECHIQTFNEPIEFYRGILARKAENAARIALLAHCFEWASQGKIAPQSVSRETIEGAIALVDFCSAQAYQIFEEIGVQSRRDPRAGKISTFIARFDGQELAWKRIKTWLPCHKGRKPSKAECLEFMRAVAASGNGFLDETGGKIFVAASRDLRA